MSPKDFVSEHTFAHTHTHTRTVAAAPSGVFFLFFFFSCFLLLKLNKIKTADAHRSLCNFKGFAVIASLSLGPFKNPIMRLMVRPEAKTQL